MYDALDLIWDAQRLGLLQDEERPIQIAKGQCPYCLKHIGTGLYRHKLACKERKH